MVTLDSSCTELGEQNQVVTKGYTVCSLELWLTNRTLLILMNNGVLKSHISLISEGVHSCYRSRNIPWYRGDTEMTQYDKFLL